MTFVIKTQDVDDTAKTVVRIDASDGILRRVFRKVTPAEKQTHRAYDIIMQLQSSVVANNDIATDKTQIDAINDIFARYRRNYKPGECHNQSDTQDMIVALRLSIMQTFWELKGYLDLPYIDSVIRQVIENFKNKHQKTTIEQKHWGILADMCQQEIDRAAKIEPEEETDPVDIDVDDISFDAWIKSEI